MPYITKDKRFELNNDFNRFPVSCGELNYMITEWINRYIKDKGLSYQTINDIVGALEGAKLEFYRRIAVPYENAKLAENGDVYGQD